MDDERDAEALYQRSDLVRLDGKVKHVTTHLVGVELPEGWAPTSFALPENTVAQGDEISVAGVEDASISGDKRRGLRAVAVRIGPESSPRYLEVGHATGDSDAGSSAPSTPKKDDLDWSDV
jgi:hypothetical protein